MNSPEYFMSRAFELAYKGWGRTSPNPMVGAVIVKKGQVIAEGWHAFCGGPHAEAAALQNAGHKAKGADLYVTLEPCGHFGRTPPCVDAIIASGIKRVFVGMRDPNPKMNGKSLAKLRSKGIIVQTGLLEEELKQLNAPFIKYITKKMPYVTAKIAQTLDGKVANLSGASQWITSQESRNFSHQWRFGVDAILVGINTVINDNPFLNAAPAKPIFKVVLDTHGRMPTKGNIYQNTPADHILIYTGRGLNKKLPATAIVAPLKNGKIDIKWVMKDLAKREIAHVLIEGGPSVIGSALEANVVDRMMIYVAPKLMGEGKSSIANLKNNKIASLLNLKDVQTSSIGPDLLIQGNIQSS